MKTLTLILFLAMLAGVNALASSATQIIGGPVTFSVTADGTTPFSYQWYKDGGVIPGATGATYSIAAVSAASAGTYTAQISNSAGSTLSDNATLAVSAPVVTAPAITVQPVSKTVSNGATVTFSVTATGTAPLSYQWYFNGVAAPGATASSVSGAASLATQGTITVTVSNSAGSVTSKPAVLTVIQPPSNGVTSIVTK